MSKTIKSIAVKKYLIGKRPPPAACDDGSIQHSYASDFARLYLFGPVRAAAATEKIAKPKPIAPIARIGTYGLNERFIRSNLIVSRRWLSPLTPCTQCELRQFRRLGPARPPISTHFFPKPRLALPDQAMPGWIRPSKYMPADFC